MSKNKNSITFDEEKQELRIITYYNKRAYLDTCFREVWPVGLHYIIETDDKWLREKVPVKKKDPISFVFIGLLTILLLYNALRGTLTVGWGLIWLGLILLLVLSYRVTFWLQKVLIHFHLMEKIGPRTRAQWKAADQLFTWSEFYKQEIHITQTERCAVETSPYVPMAIVPGREYLKVIHMGDDVFFLQFGIIGKRLKLLTFPQTLHFKAQNYTAVEWELLIGKAKKMGYL